MTTTVINDFAKYSEFCNLQVASEAFLVEKIKRSGTNFDNGLGSYELKKALLKGNEHSSIFTNVQADDFVNKWEVVAHQGNTSTGFSGTLFKAKDNIPEAGIVKGQYVISFRSTEFIEDSIHDNRATNTLEIKEKGWAFGQISDMEKWFSEIKSTIDGPLSVTGYSLGGHLATAFNILHYGEGVIRDTYTYNGAGVGFINGANSIEETQAGLKQVISEFTERKNASLDDSKFTSEFNSTVSGAPGPMGTELMTVSVSAVYKHISGLLKDLGVPARAATATATVDDLSNYKQRVLEAYDYVGLNIDKLLYLQTSDTTARDGVRQELLLLQEAIKRIREMVNEYVRVSAIFTQTGGKGFDERIYSASEIDALRLNYQLSAVLAAQKTSPLDVIEGAININLDIVGILRKR